MRGHIDFLELWHNLPFNHQWLIGYACKPRGSKNVKVLREDTGIPFPRSRFLKLKRVICVVKLVFSQTKSKAFANVKKYDLTIFKDFNCPPNDEGQDVICIP